MDRQHKLIWRKMQEDHGSATGGRPICMQEHNRLAIRGCRMMSSLTLITARQEEAARMPHARHRWAARGASGQDDPRAGFVSPGVGDASTEGTLLLVSAMLLRKEKKRRLPHVYDIQRSGQNIST